MGKTEIRTVCKVDFDKPASEQPQLHVSDSVSFYPNLVIQVKIQKLTKPFYPLPTLKQNRWHPDIPFAGSIKDGETVKIECVDWTGGQIGNNDSADDMKNVDLTKIHYLSGPFEVEGAQPGDLLLVEIMDVQPFQDRPWGFTGIFDKANGVCSSFSLFPSPLGVGGSKTVADWESGTGRLPRRNLPLSGQSHLGL